MRVALTAESCVLIFAFLLGGCGGRSDERLETAARRFSGAALYWYHGAGSKIGSDYRKQFCRNNEAAPVSWRYVATACSPETLDSPEKFFDASWKSQENELWFNNPEQSTLR